MATWTGFRRAAAAGVSVLALAGCGDDDPTDRGEEATTGPSSTPSTVDGGAQDAPGDLDAYVGLAVEEAGARADAEGRPWRVVKEDGEDLPVTLDYVPERLDFEVEGGVVVRVTTG
ncbi:MAG: hypothetical protein KatS3mg009_2881 [Acidimicrobiia bacterium]|nr:MAG: hypothetical protein KatS3mg009_2881 [Acidimicrobiia bacterium]